MTRGDFSAEKISDHEDRKQGHQRHHADEQVYRQFQEQFVRLLVLGIVHGRMACLRIDVHPLPLCLSIFFVARISTKVGKPAIGWIGLFHTGQDQIDDGISQIEISGIQSVEAGELDLDIGLAVAVHVALDQRQIVGCVELIAQLGGLRRALD